MYTSQDFAEYQQNVAQSYDCRTVTYRSSGQGQHAVINYKSYTARFKLIVKIYATFHILSQSIFLYNGLLIYFTSCSKPTVFYCVSWCHLNIKLKTSWIFEVYQQPSKWALIIWKFCRITNVALKSVELYLTLYNSLVTQLEVKMCLETPVKEVKRILLLQ